MKNKIILIALFTSYLGFAQETVTKEVTKSMSKGLQPGIEIFIPKVSEDNLEEAIEEVTKPYKGKSRSIKKTDEFFIDDAFIEQISPNTIDIHQTIKETANGLTYTVYFDLGGIFLSNSYNPEKYNYAINIVQKIANKAVENRMQNVLKVENKNLENLEDEKKALEKENEKSAKEIEDANDLIAKKKNEMEENKKMIEKKATEIEKQHQLIKNIEK
jgi:hypothetical protein